MFSRYVTCVDQVSKMRTRRAESIETFAKYDKTKEGSIDELPSLWFSKRFFVAVVIFLCFINIGMILANMNIAIVEMTSAKSFVLGNDTIVRPAEFEWDPSVVGLVCSIISYGGLFSLAGGIFIDKLGGSVSCAFVSMLCGIFTILQPASLYANFSLFIVLRLLTGFFANCFYVSAAETYSRWFPKRERSTLICFCVNGANVGVTMVNPLFGYVADRLGWQMVFYFSGTISLVASLLFYIVVKNRPTEDVWISDEELAYILEETRETSQKKISHRRHPYKEILLSPAVWALCAADFVMIWINNVTGACLPLYAKDAIGESTDEIGLISGIPMSLTIVMYPLIGTIMDYCRNHSHIDRTRIDKAVIGFTFTLISCLFLACAIFSNFTISVILFALIMMAVSAAPAIFEPNTVNIAPNDSSVVSALTKVCSSSGMIVGRTLTGFMTINHTAQEWNNTFLVSSVVVITGGAIFLKFGSSEAQPWSVLSNTEDEYEYLVKDQNGNV